MATAGGFGAVVAGPLEDLQLPDAASDPPPCRAIQLPPLGNLVTKEYTLKRLVDKGQLEELDTADMEWNLKHCTLRTVCGGEAAVHIVRWRTPPGLAPCAIGDGREVAIKVYHKPDGPGFLKLNNTWDMQQEADFGKFNLQKEVNMLDILCSSGHKASTPHVCGIFRRMEGPDHLPLHGYVMPLYEHGSLASLLRNTCQRLIPESTFTSFFSAPKLAGHYATLHKVLLHLSTAVPRDAEPSARPGLLLQDISSNNVLVQADAGGGCTLLFSDPSQAQLASCLERERTGFTATWLWGCFSAAHNKFDPLADVFSLNIVFLEVWAVAEGSPITLFDLASTIQVKGDLGMGVTFLRAQCVAILKRRQRSSDACIVPRGARCLPLSWLHLWALLLGTSAFKSVEELSSGRRHRRPSAADMTDVSARLASISSKAEALGGSSLDITAAALQEPAGVLLVQECVELHAMLARLTRPPDEADLLPLDESLGWVGYHFLRQDHPLVVAMHEKGAVAVQADGFPAAIDRPEFSETWLGAVHRSTRLTCPLCEVLCLMTYCPGG